MTSMVASRKLSDEERPRCTEPGCERAAEKRGLCGLHYRQHSRAGTLPTRWLSLSSGVAHIVEAAAPARRCKYPRCRRDSEREGYCMLHYGRRYPADRDAREHVGHPDPWHAGQSMRGADESVDEFLGRSVREECDPSYIRHPKPDE